MWDLGGAWEGVKPPSVPGYPFWLWERSFSPSQQGGHPKLVSQREAGMFPGTSRAPPKPTQAENWNGAVWKIHDGAVIHGF